MRTTSYLNMPRRMNELWEWVNAVSAFDYGDPEPLANLVRSTPAIPDEFRPAVADVIQGKRTPNLKAASKLKVPARERMRLAGTLSIVTGLADVLRRVPQVGDEGETGAIGIADRKGVEPIKVARELEATARDAIRDAASDWGVSVETIENLLRELKDRIERWPVV